MSHRAASRVVFHWFTPRTSVLVVQEVSVSRLLVSQPVLDRVQVSLPRVTKATLFERTPEAPEPQVLLDLGLREVFLRANPTLADLLRRAQQSFPAATEDTVLDFIKLLNRQLRGPEVLWVAETGQWGMLPWVKLGVPFQGGRHQGKYRAFSLEFWEVRSRSVDRRQFEGEVRTHEFDPVVRAEALGLPQVPELVRTSPPGETEVASWVGVEVRGRALWICPHRFPKGRLLTERRGGRVTPIQVHQGQLMHGYVSINPQWSTMLEWMLKLSETPLGGATSKDGRGFQLHDAAQEVVQQLLKALRAPG